MSLCVQDVSRKIFGTFVSDVVKFRLFLKRYGGVVCGGTVLRGFGGLDWNPDEMHVLVRESSMNSVGLYIFHSLMSGDGYCLDELSEMDRLLYGVVSLFFIFVD